MSCGVDSERMCRDFGLEFRKSEAACRAITGIVHTADERGEQQHLQNKT